jgi:myo-inositol-1(or 4)-monophosphatase
MPDISNALIVKTLESALREAGKIIMHFHARSPKISLKGPVDLVTEADKAADRKIIQVVKRRFPDHGFLTEESGAEISRSRFRWIIDPVDGTTNFAHKLPHACVSIGVEENGRMRAGGVFDPFRKELFLAVRGKGSRLNGRPIKVSRTTRLIDSLLATGFPYDRYKLAPFYLESNIRFMKKTQGIRRQGSAALDLSYVACGRYDGYWEFRLNPWDISAGWLLLEEAGGKLTDYRGRPMVLNGAVQAVASNGRIHGDMIKTLKGLDRI